MEHGVLYTHDDNAKSCIETSAFACFFSVDWIKRKTSFFLLLSSFSQIPRTQPDDGSHCICTLKSLFVKTFQEKLKIL
jgi:hypothetical protein